MVIEGLIGPPLEALPFGLAPRPNPLFGGPEAPTFGVEQEGVSRVAPSPQPPAPILLVDRYSCATGPPVPPILSQPQDRYLGGWGSDRTSPYKDEIHCFTEGIH